MDLNELFGFPPRGAAAGTRIRSVAELRRVAGSGPAAVEAWVQPQYESVRLESVIGVDERLRVPDTTSEPWRKICCLTITGGNGAVARGTAWFVGPKTLLTAGHCVYSTLLFNGWAREISVEPARHDEELPFATAKTMWFSALADWVQSESPESDVACIQLDEPLGDTVGWFSVDTAFDDVPDPATVTIAGYPVDRNGGKVMYYNRAQLLRSSASQLFYDVDTVGGQSGAPIWVDDHDGSARAIGIHAYGASGKLDPVLGVEANSGRRITPELLATIAGWLIENP